MMCFELSNTKTNHHKNYSNQNIYISNRIIIYLFFISANHQHHYHRHNHLNKTQQPHHHHHPYSSPPLRFSTTLQTTTSSPPQTRAHNSSINLSSPKSPSSTCTVRRACRQHQQRLLQYL